MWDSKLFKTGVGILLLFLIIYVGSLISFIFYPLVVAFEALFISFLISGILYYFTYPFVDWLHVHKLPRAVAIFITFLVIIGLLILLGFIIVPILQREFTRLADSIPLIIDQLRELLKILEESPILAELIDLEELDLERITERVAAVVSNTLAQIATSIAAAADFATNVFITIIIVPFLLYYMLKEKGSGLFYRAVSALSPKDYADEIKSALAEMNRLLAAYVQGLAVVCFFVGALAYVGFLIIGLDYALILSIFIMITNVVPFLGPFIGAIPAVIVGFLDSPLMMIAVIILIIVVQQAESLLISPQVMGRKLALSPLAIILIVLVAGRLGGLLGIILAIPTFTVLKIITTHVYEHIRYHKEIQNPQEK